MRSPSFRNGSRSAGRPESEDMNGGEGGDDEGGSDSLINGKGDQRHTDREPLTSIGLFAGIGGIELGMQRAGHRCTLLCEVDPDAQAVLSMRFPNVRLRSDIRKIKRLPAADLWTAGFPCKDLSQAGLTAGINGRHSGLVQHVFRLLPKNGGPTWLLFENVPFMLQLDGGRAMRSLIKQLEKRGFRWAYRVVDSRCFGLPQRRRRVVLLASRTQDPRGVLLAQDAGISRRRRSKTTACGFYWTEGNTGLGWAEDAIPTLKGGSNLGIPSPPAIWLPTKGIIGTPDIRDAERLQGFPAGWTRTAAPRGKRQGARWKLVGNAVTVALAKWLGCRLRNPKRYDASQDEPLKNGAPWPEAAWGDGKKRYASRVSAWPVEWRHHKLSEFLRFPIRLLTIKAASGFHTRLTASSLRRDAGFLNALARHIEKATALSD